MQFRPRWLSVVVTGCRDFPSLFQPHQTEPRQNPLRRTAGDLVSMVLGSGISDMESTKELVEEQKELVADKYEEAEFRI